jgi:hypothetical protein
VENRFASFPPYAGYAFCRVVNAEGLATIGAKKFPALCTKGGQSLRELTTLRDAFLAIPNNGGQITLH